MAKRKFASLTADMIKRVPTRIIDADGSIFPTFAFIAEPGSARERVCTACGSQLAA